MQSAKRMKEVTEIPKEILKDLVFDLIDVKLHQKNVLDKKDFILLKSYEKNEDQIEILMEIMRNKSEEEHENFLEIMTEDYNWIRDKCEIFFQKSRIEQLKRQKKAASKSVCVSEEKEESKEESENQKEPESVEENDKTFIPLKNSSSPDSKAMSPRKDEDNTPVHKIEMEKDSTKLQQTITPEMMNIVRRNHRVVKRWTALAHTLGMTPFVHTLRMRMLINGEDVDAAVLYLLEEWKGAHSKEASLGKLISTLREENFNDVADELLENFA